LHGKYNFGGAIAIRLSCSSSESKRTVRGEYPRSGVKSIINYDWIGITPLRMLAHGSFSHTSADLQDMLINANLLTARKGFYIAGKARGWTTYLIHS